MRANSKRIQPAETEAVTNLVRNFVRSWKKIGNRESKKLRE